MEQQEHVVGKAGSTILVQKSTQDSSKTTKNQSESNYPMPLTTENESSSQFSTNNKVVISHIHHNKPVRESVVQYGGIVPTDNSESLK